MASYTSCSFSCIISETVSHLQFTDLHQSFASGDNSSSGTPLSPSTSHCEYIKRRAIIHLLITVDMPRNEKNGNFQPKFDQENIRISGTFDLSNILTEIELRA